MIKWVHLLLKLVKNFGNSQKIKTSIGTTNEKRTVHTLNENTKILKNYIILKIHSTKLEDDELDSISFLYW